MTVVRMCRFNFDKSVRVGRRSQVSATVAFAQLMISAFDDPAFDAGFRADLVADVSATAGVKPGAVFIKSILPGATQSIVSS